MPSIGQYRNVIKQVCDQSQFIGLDDDGVAIFDRTLKAPVLTFTGTVKLHGTCASIGFNLKQPTDYWCQSKESIIEVGKDNAGFAAYVHFHKKEYESILINIRALLYHNLGNYDQFTDAVIYGEWCGSSIQKGVGINGLPKMFVVFGIKLISKNQDDSANVWVSDQLLKDIITNNPEINLYNIFTFGEWSIDIDFSQPEQSQNKIIELTLAVENECPCAKYFGIENGVGEGLVFKHDSEKYGTLRYKSKGLKHSVSKVKTLAPVDIERVNSIADLVDVILTENRLQQGLEHLRLNHLELDQKNTGSFIKWIANDVIKEEVDQILGNNLDIPEVLKVVSKKSKEWFFTQIFSV
jgi:hypothetical protein